VWDRAAALLPHSYVASVVAAGGLPVLLPPVASPGGAAARRAVEGLDALLLTGGADIEPVRYGAEPQPTTQAARPDRDRWESDLLDAALDRDRDLPVLAVCRGAQVLNVARGGTLHQHLPDVVGHEGHQPGPAVLGTTPVRLAAGSLAAAVLGTEVKVPCYHHQAIDRLGTAVEAVGRADDGTIEAVVLRGRRFVLGVQWHPEDGDDPRLFEALVAVATAATATAAAGPEAR
jgi:gamma-glutamyl-gamma-aminobutyrate hydrolase PuuD